MSSLPDNARQAFTSLALPAFDPSRAFYLNSVAGFELTAESAIETLKLTSAFFSDPEDQQLARRLNSVWMWEEMGSPNNDQRHVGAASSLPKLLAPHALPGQEEKQRLGADLYARLFPKVSLCHCDFLETGHDTVKGFLKSDDVYDGFFGDTPDLQKAVESNVIWTMVSMTASRTLYAASSLERVLTRAWEHDPRLALQARLESGLPTPKPVHKMGRF